MQKIQAFFKPNDYEKKSGRSAEGKGVRITSPFTVGVAGLALSMDSKGRIGAEPHTHPPRKSGIPTDAR